MKKTLEDDVVEVARLVHSVSTQDVTMDEQWTHPSILSLTPPRGDPVTEITIRARRLVLQAMSEGWSGPPFDPMQLALLQQITTRPCADIEDARIVPMDDKTFLIEFNPNRPRARIRYSIAYEIAHTLFPDCRDDVRHRIKKSEVTGDDWQLEMLCNMAAAEILMPFGTLPDLDATPLSIERVGDLRRQYEVSTEAILLRAVKLSRQAISAFASSRVEQGPNSGRYRIDYIVPSRGWTPKLRAGMLLPPDTLLAGCTAVGYTAKGNEEWCPGDDGRLHFEVVGVKPYADRLYPRVLGLLRPLRNRQVPQSSINYVVGDATAPNGTGHKIIAHIVNDKTPNWGAGFAAVIKNKWPPVQEEFQFWARSEKENLKLGNAHFTRLETSLSICHMISQHGYGPAAKPRIRYDALADCLEQLAEHAANQDASIHMPRIGTGHAGGDWKIVEELITEILCARDVSVTVYDLRAAKSVRQSAQGKLFGVR